MIERLREGSFRGARFYVRTAVTTGGRKQVKHEYPNSNKQRIEDLGFKPRNFRLSVIVAADPADTGGQSYFDKRDALLAALEKEGEGTLSHPFFSTSVEVVARNYTLNEDISVLGQATLELEFDFSDGSTDPQPSKTSLPQVNNGVQAVFREVNSEIASEWLVESPFNFDKARELLDGFAAFTETATNTFNPVEDKVSEFNGMLGDFQAEVVQLIQAPQDLADEFTTLIDASSALYQTTAESLTVFSRFFGFGDDITPIEETTYYRTQRKNNNRLITQGAQTCYLALSYQFAAEAEYTTVDDVEAVRNSLDDQYQKVVDQGLNSEIQLMLNSLRVQANLFLEEARLNAAQLVTIDVKSRPMSVIAFEQYGYTEQLESLTTTLIDLNQANDVSFVAGEIEVLTV